MSIFPISTMALIRFPDVDHEMNHFLNAFLKLNPIYEINSRFDHWGATGLQCAGHTSDVES